MDPKHTYHLHRDHPKACGDVAGGMVAAVFLCAIAAGVLWVVEHLT